MKDWCLKHPFMTFVLVEEILTTIRAIVCRDGTTSVVHNMAETTVNTINEVREKVKETKKQPIGFVVS